MKKTIILYVCMVFMLCTASQAQTPPVDYCPMAEEGKTWEIQVGGIKENVYDYQIIGDTLINGEVWKKVYNYKGWPDGMEKTYYAAIRDAGKKVYAIAIGSNRPRLCYDFGLQVGDIISCGVESNVFGCLLDTDDEPDTMLGFQFNAYLKVENIDVVTVYGQDRRRFTLTLLDSYQEPMLTANKVVWYEGVGSAVCPFLPWLPQQEEGIIQSCHTELTAINILRFSKNCDNNFFNLLGQLLTNSCIKGLYIQNGKKVVVK